MTNQLLCSLTWHRVYSDFHTWDLHFYFGYVLLLLLNAHRSHREYVSPQRYKNKKNVRGDYKRSGKSAMFKDRKGSNGIYENLQR